jgi:hypothetical protein
MTHKCKGFTILPAKEVVNTKMSQYTKQNAIHKILGYHILRPGETKQSQEAFDRAKAETIENLSNDLQAVRDMTFDKFCQL